MQDTDVAETLALVNIARQAFGKDMLTELPDAKPGVSSDCLYYRALTDIGCKSVDGYGNMKFDDPRKANHIAALWGVEAEGNTVKVSRGARGFRRVISDFDTSQLPHFNTDKGRDF